MTKGASLRDRATHEQSQQAVSAVPVGIPSAVSDPMEQLIAAALDAANVEYSTDYGGGNPSGLDFLLPNEGVEIEVKRMHTPRIADQMARAENVIVAQGPKAVALLAALIQRGM